MNYINIIKTACIYFPIIALIVTIPYILKEYHKYGSIHLLRAFIIYSFILYLMTSYFLVILPLPSIETVRNMTSSYIQLIPFKFIYNIILKVKFNYLFFTNKEVYEVLFNILLTVPLGLYLRYFFKLDKKKVIKLSFLYSLFFELTQLTGLYFIYPRPYRIFDIDDLILNTFGGYLGYVLTPIITKKLPTRDELDILAYKLGTKISIFKRLVSILIDISIYIILLVAFRKIKYIEIIMFIIYFILIPSLTKGYTFGKKFVNIKLITLSFDTPKWYQYVARYILLLLDIVILLIVLIGIPLLIVGNYNNLITTLNSEYVIVLLITYIFVILTISMYLLINNIINKKLFLYEKISKTKNISTITIPK